jgi:hypothetical protein
MSLMTVRVECSRTHTPLVAVGSTQRGLLTYTLDPQHFSQVAADRIGTILDTLATNGSWRFHGGNHRCVTEFEVIRNPAPPSGVPVVFCNVPGWTAISIDADEMTEVGRIALADAILVQLSGWEQVATLG